MKCTIAVLFALTAFGGPTLGAIVYSGLLNVELPHESEQTVSLNLGGAPDVKIEIERGSYIFSSFGAGDNYWAWRVSSTPLVAGIGQDSWIGPGEEWERIHFGLRLILAYDDERHPWHGMGDFYDQTDRYMPLRILNNEEVFFGWLRLSHDAQAGLLTVHDWAWNSASGQPILAGEIPEPATAALLTGLALLAWVIRETRK